MDIGKIDKVWEIHPATKPEELPFTFPDPWPDTAPAEPEPQRREEPVRRGTEEP